MTAAYSVDFRKKIVEAYDQGDTSYSEAALYGNGQNEWRNFLEFYREALRDS